MSLMMRLRLAQDGATHPCPQQRSAQFHLMALVQLWSSMNDICFMLSSWTLRGLWWWKQCAVSVKHVMHPMLHASPSNDWSSQFILSSNSTAWLWGCLSVRCSWWWRCKESVEYIFLKWKLQKQYCLKHVMYPMLRGSHLIFDVSSSYFHQTNVSSCYGWQYAYNHQHLPHVTTLKANS